MVDYVRCRRCDGHGLVRLVPSLQRTLDLVRGGATSSSAMARAEKTTHQAMCNRLEELRTMGFVRREPVSGKEWAYYEVPQRGARKASAK